MRGKSKLALYGAALSWYVRTEKLTRACLVGLFLGAFDARDRAALDETHYDGAQELVDGVPRRYADPAAVHSGLFPWEQAAIETHFRPGCSIAVIGAGAGREVLALAQAGFDVHGYDPHRGLVREGGALLEAAGYGGRLHVSERDVLPRLATVPDAIVIGWGTYSLIAGRSRRIALLAAAAGLIGPGAPIMVSFMPSPPDSASLQVAHRIARVIRRVRGTEPPEVGDWLMPNFVHFFAHREMEIEMEHAGLILEASATNPYGWAVARVGSHLREPG